MSKRGSEPDVNGSAPTSESDVASPASRAAPLSATEEALRTRSTAIRILRMTFAVLLLTVTTVYIIDTGSATSGDRTFTFIPGWEIPLATAVLVGFGLIALDVLTPRKRLSVVGAVVVGAVIGGVATLFFSAIIDLFVKTYSIGATSPLIDAVKVLMGIGLIYLGITIVLQTQDDFRLVIPYVEFAKQLRGPRPMLLDTSAIIDGRVLDLAATGLLQTPVVVPRFVVDELQTLADSGDKLQRSKGRRGLEIVGKLQRTPGLDISVDETPVPGKAVDQMLVELARRMPAVIVTSDTGLNRVATIQGVRVLNINEVANAFKIALLPGVVVSVRIIKEGEQDGQGVGYMDDGTMIVVENAGQSVGEDVRAEVTSSMQTAAGRLIFARNVEVLSRSASPDQASDAPEPGAGGDATSTIAEPIRVIPPTTPHRPGPFGPGQQRKVPNRNPRRD